MSPKEELYTKTGENAVWVLIKRTKKFVVLKAAFSSEVRCPTRLTFGRDYRPLTKTGRIG